MFSVTKSIDVDFAHHVAGHTGACINIHGHTWKFEVTVKCLSLTRMGFVLDFKELKTKVLEPVHTLLDHSLAMYEKTFEAAKEPLALVGNILCNTRSDKENVQEMLEGNTAPGILGYRHVGDQDLRMAKNVICGGMKIATFPFSPTSERLAQWLFKFAQGELEQSSGPQPLKIAKTRIYETLHPVEAYAEYSEDLG